MPGYSAANPLPVTVTSPPSTGATLTATEGPGAALAGLAPAVIPLAINRTVINAASEAGTAVLRRDDTGCDLRVRDGISRAGRNLGKPNLTVSRSATRLRPQLKTVGTIAGTSEF